MERWPGPNLDRLKERRVYMREQARKRGKKETGRERERGFGGGEGVHTSLVLVLRLRRIGGIKVDGGS